MNDDNEIDYNYYVSIKVTPEEYDSWDNSFFPEIAKFDNLNLFLNMDFDFSFTSSPRRTNNQKSQNAKIRVNWKNEGF